MWLLKVGLNAQPCNAYYSFIKLNELVSFQNLSNINNAHFYWNFGDGTGSNYENPNHVYYEDGNYLVTLYVLNKSTNCSSFYDTLISVTKFSNTSCAPILTDSIYSFDNNYDYLKLLDKSVNCNNFNAAYNVGSLPFYKPKTAALPKTPGNYIAYVRFDDGVNLVKTGFKTCPNNFNRNKNYNNCSANFEFKVVSENNLGQRILFTAMNKHLKAYNWSISGLGDPIKSITDTLSAFFYGNINQYNHPYQP